MVAIELKVLSTRVLVSPFIWVIHISLKRFQKHEIQTHVITSPRPLTSQLFFSLFPAYNTKLATFYLWHTTG